jgi:alanyl-tRNA synthetase
MTKPTSDEIRSTFLEFFKSKGHAVVASAGVIPRNDPTLLFTNAGMVQFKDAFLGDDKRPYTRAATSQKCVRMSGKHNDLDNVGHTARHHTFFEMLGNFSFGDYFKRDAITYAWELLTTVWKLPPTTWSSRSSAARTASRPTTRPGDLARGHRLRRRPHHRPRPRRQLLDHGRHGPLRAVHGDPLLHGRREPDLEPASTRSPRPTAPAGWRSGTVFMQFNRAVKDGPLVPLPAPCVDTGMGLERITAVLQGVRTNYDTDLLRPLVDRAAAIGGRPTTAATEFDVACRVHRRPRAHDGLRPRRGHHPLQQGPRRRAALGDAPGDPLRVPPGAARADLRQGRRAGDRPDGRGLPGAVAAP